MLYKSTRLNRHSTSVNGWAAIFTGIVIGAILILTV